MQPIYRPILLVTAYLVIYLLALYSGFSENIIICLYLFSPVAVVWMVVKILKKGMPSEKRFTEYFYEDWDYKRNTDGHEEE